MLSCVDISVSFLSEWNPGAVEFNESWDLIAWKQMFYYATLVSQYINSSVYFHAPQQHAIKFNRLNHQLLLKNWISLLGVFGVFVFVFLNI